jgi:dCMP deaminase
MSTFVHTEDCDGHCGGHGCGQGLEGPTGLAVYDRDAVSNKMRCSRHGLFDLDFSNCDYNFACPKCAKEHQEQLALEHLLQKYAFIGNERELKWHRRFLALAQHWADACSKDPSTKVGAALTSPDRRKIVLGYNGFPPGVNDSEERYSDREEKYARVSHAESNAIDNASCELTGWTLYVHPLLPCSGRHGGHNCAGRIISNHIARVIVPVSALTNERWRGSCATSLEMFQEAGVEVVAIEE